MTAPYYADDNVALYHGDCLDLLDVWAPPSWAATGPCLMVTDPPYGIKQGVWGPRLNGAKGIVTATPVRQLAGDEDTSLRDEVLSYWGERPALVFGSWKAPRPARTRARLLWLKANITPCLGNCPWSPADEEIYVLGHGWGEPDRLNYIITTEARAGAGGLAAVVGHPTPKPVDLMRQLLDACPPGLIVDPFAGSGATLRAAKDLGRQAIGIELDERYCEIAARSLAQEVLAL